MPGKVAGWIKLTSGIGGLLFFAGCYHTPKNSAGIQNSTTQEIAATGVDNYVYYPAYGIYYNTTRHQYVYWEGRSWVDRPSLPAVWAKHLSDSPVVPVDFHDAPEKHHATVAQNYPGTWQAEPSKVTPASAVQ